MLEMLEDPTLGEKKDWFAFPTMEEKQAILMGMSGAFKNMENQRKIDNETVMVNTGVVGEKDRYCGGYIYKDLCDNSVVSGEIYSSRYDKMLEKLKLSKVVEYDFEKEERESRESREAKEAEAELREREELEAAKRKSEEMAAAEEAMDLVDEGDDEAIDMELAEDDDDDNNNENPPSPTPPTTTTEQTDIVTPPPTNTTQSHRGRRFSSSPIINTNITATPETTTTLTPSPPSAAAPPQKQQQQQQQQQLSKKEQIEIAEKDLFNSIDGALKIYLERIRAAQTISEKEETATTTADSTKTNTSNNIDSIRGLLASFA